MEIPDFLRDHLMEIPKASNRPLPLENPMFLNRGSADINWNSPLQQSSVVYPVGLGSEVISIQGLGSQVISMQEVFEDDVITINGDTRYMF